MSNMIFMNEFDDQFGPKLGNRQPSFRIIFERLCKSAHINPIIVETGCARQADNWEGDGQSTRLFDRYVETCPQGRVFSVDIDPSATAYARKMTGAKTHVETADSVRYLNLLAREFLANGQVPDLVYLDSFDVDHDNPVPSGVHHLKEFCALRPCLGPQTMIVIDDSPKIFTGWMSAPDKLTMGKFASESGKGKFLIDYLRTTGAEPIFEFYQVGFVLGQSAPV